MSLTARFDNGKQYHLATNTGWGDVIRWADTLDLAKFGEFVSLCEHGFANETDVVQEQLAEAIRTEPPETADVERTARRLLKMLQRHPGGAVVVGDGLSS